jgi:hypothetical protein
MIVDGLLEHGSGAGNVALPHERVAFGQQFGEITHLGILVWASCAVILPDMAETGLPALTRRTPEHAGKKMVASSDGFRREIQPDFYRLIGVGMPGFEPHGLVATRERLVNNDRN